MSDGPPWGLAWAVLGITAEGCTETLALMAEQLDANELLATKAWRETLTRPYTRFQVEPVSVYANAGEALRWAKIDRGPVAKRARRS